MDKQAAAERSRREMVTLAEAKKRSVELDAEAQLIRVQVECGVYVDTQTYRHPPNSLILPLEGGGNMKYMRYLRTRMISP